METDLYISGRNEKNTLQNVKLQNVKLVCSIYFPIRMRNTTNLTD